MAGIFPSGGIDARNTQNAELDVRVIAQCAALFYRLGCNPRFDPLSTNAILSEIANVVNDLGLDYDCNRLDNMSLAIQNAILTKNYPVLDPDMDDTVRGSYDGVEGQAFIKKLLELAPTGLDEVTTLSDQDRIFVGVQGVGRNISFAQFKALVTPSTPSVPPIFGSNYRWQTLPGDQGNFLGATYQNAYGVPIMFWNNASWYRSAGRIYVGINPDSPLDNPAWGYAWEDDGNGGNQNRPSDRFSIIITPGQYYFIMGLQNFQILAP